MPVSGTTITSSTDVAEAMLERVDQNVTELFESTDTVASLIKKSGRAEKLSEKLYRFPLMKYFGGVYGKFDANAGTMNDGSGPVVTKMTAGYVYSELGFELSMQAIDTTDSEEKSVLNLMRTIVEGAMDEHDVYEDIGFHNDGTGVLTGAASTGGAAYLTFAGASDYVGVSRLRPGMKVGFYNASGSAFGTANTISVVDVPNKKVTFTANLSESGAAGDYLVITGITTEPPASFSANYPATSLTADDWRHGLYYFNDYTSSNYCLGLLKSSLPELIPAVKDGSSNDISFADGQDILDELQNRRDPGVTNGLVGLANQKQRAKIFAETRAMTSFFRTDSKLGSSVDANPTNNAYTDRFEFCGIPMIVDKRQYTNRIDFINPSKWGRAVVRDTGFLKNKSGGYLFEGRASSGALKASTLFKIVSGYDFFCSDPGASGVIHSLAV